MMASLFADCLQAQGRIRRGEPYALAISVDAVAISTRTRTYELPLGFYEREARKLLEDPGIGRPEDVERWLESAPDVVARGVAEA